MSHDANYAALRAKRPGNEISDLRDFLTELSEDADALVHIPGAAFETLLDKASSEIEKRLQSISKNYGYK